MNTKFCVAAVLVTLVSGCASTNDLAANDQTRIRVLAELEQARVDGLVPVTEADYLVLLHWQAEVELPSSGTRTPHAGRTCRASV
ncbi:DUF4148 domain-containing protein [Massilia niastensis]|uniref:DUF4148 domain-containing protein n=1 Tax=Massilia niastensis TaxID=544911 RepID=UPI0012EC80B5